MRLYYHVAGMDDDTVTLDAALVIDDEEGFLLDNDPDFVLRQYPKDKKIIRAGFNDSGVSINHRAIERIPLQYVQGKPLWRGFEFKDKSKAGFQEHDLFQFPAGPIFGISNDDEVGHECINMMTPRFTLLDDKEVRTLSLVDAGLLYPSNMPNGREPLVVRKLKDPSVTGEIRVTLEAEFEKTFGHTDFQNWRSEDYIRVHGGLPIRREGLYAGKQMIQCELNVAIQQWPEGMRNNPIAHRHETLEY